MRRWLVLLALTTACGPQHPAFQPPADPPSLHVGVNLGHERITPIYLDRLASSGTSLTLRVPVHSLAEAKDVLQAVQPYPTLSVLLLVEKPDLNLVTALAPLDRGFAWPGRLAGIELGNELDLAGLSLYQFADFTAQAVTILRRADWSTAIVTGGIYTVDDASLRYASFMLDSLPCEALFGVHLYQDSDDGVLASLQAAAGCHRIAVTEFGMPSRTPQEDAAQVVYLRSKLAAFTRLGAAYALIYQMVSGPSSSNLDNFGLLRFNDSPKPAWEILR